jgi:hypothetical protein
MALKVELTQKLINALTFNKQLVDVTPDGQPIYQDTPANIDEWVIRDGGAKGEPGLLLRITSGAMTWGVRRKMNGKSVRRALGRARKSDDFSGAILDLETARKRASAWLTLMENKKDPRDLREAHMKETALAANHRRLTMAVAFSEFIETKRKHKTKLPNGEKLEVGVGQRRKVDPKLRDASTADRVKVQRWMTGSPMWHVPVKDLTEKDVTASLTPFLARANGMRVSINWGPKSVSKGTMDKIYGELERAWWRAANALKIGLVRSESPLHAWRQAHESDWPGERKVLTALDTHADTHVVWLKALMAMQTAAHDPTVFTDRAAPRSKGIKPHLSVLIDFYLLLMLWGTRQTETMLLEWDQVDFKQNLIWLAGDTTKSGAKDVIPLTPWVADLLNERKRLNELWRPEETARYVFPSREHGHPITSPRGVLVALAETTGVALTAHDLRRSLARELGSDEILLHTARLLVSGAALHHGAGRGGSRVAGATERYLGDRAEILRPLYQQREDRLRQLVGLPVANQKSLEANEDEKMLAKAQADPAFAARMMKLMLKS